MSKKEEEEESVYENTNGMPMAGGRNLHMEVGPGEIANRIVTVGSQQRASKIAAFLDTTTPISTITSSRGFTTITGTYNNVPVSIVAIGMGPSMMDFFVRETRAVVKGPIAIVRFGTCGGLAAAANAGVIAVATKGSGFVTRNPDAFAHNYGNENNNDDSYKNKYIMSKIAPSEESLSNLVSSQLKEALGEEAVLEGANVTAESFYSSQGRIDPNFDDGNENVINDIITTYPTAISMEMETFTLLHLAKSSREIIKASAAAIVVANRLSAKVIDGNTLDKLEELGGKAILNAVCKISL